jgi:hypothetical protein
MSPPYCCVLGNIAQLLPTLQRYISKRREMADQLRNPAPLAVLGSSNSLDMDVPFKAERLSSSRSFSSLAASNDISIPLADFISVGHGTSRTLQTTSSLSTPTPTPSDHDKTTHQMLSHIAWLADELFRASEEKVNLVQAAFDSVSPLMVLSSAC